MADTIHYLVKIKRKLVGTQPIESKCPKYQRVYGKPDPPPLLTWPLMGKTLLEGTAQGRCYPHGSKLLIHPQEHHRLL